MFNFWRSGMADITVDAAAIFTAPQPVTSTTTWQVTGVNRLTAGVSQAGLGIGAYTATVTIQRRAVRVPVRLLVVEVERVYLPMIRR